MALAPHPATGLGVLAVGMLTLDCVQVIDRLPAADEKTWGRSQHIAFGGPAANAAATAAALGPLTPIPSRGPAGAPTRLLAPFGRSRLTGLLGELLAAAGVDWIDPTPDVEHPTPVSTVLITASTGERAVIAGGAPPLPVWAPDSGSELEHRVDGWLDGIGAVLVDGHALPWALAVAAAARARGIPVVFDGGSHKPGTAQLLAHVDLAILSAVVRAPDASDPLAWVLAHGPRYAAQSAGADPLRWRGAGGTDRLVPVEAVPVLDTLAAGDVLHGAATAAAARVGVGEPGVEAILRFAVGVATVSVGHPGALGWAADPVARSTVHALSTAFVHSLVDRVEEG